LFVDVCGFCDRRGQKRERSGKGKVCLVASKRERESKGGGRSKEKKVRRRRVGLDKVSDKGKEE
jgi:hypothetical protein